MASARGRYTSRRITVMLKSLSQTENQVLQILFYLSITHINNEKS